MKNRGVIAVIIAGVIIIALGWLLLRSRSIPDDLQTGGSGIPEFGYLVIQGYESPSNDDLKIPLGKFLSSDKQVIIRKNLEGLLYEKSPEQEYRGVILPESVDVNYETNVISFKVEVKKPAVIYVVKYNTFTGDLKVFDQNNQPLNLKE